MHPKEVVVLGQCYQTRRKFKYLTVGKKKEIKETFPHMKYKGFV